MPLTLEQYATYLDTRHDLSWPAPPEIDRPRAKPHLVRLPDVRVVTWSVYGTLLAISGGELYFEHPQEFIMDLALDKTIQEFKMWGAMSRKPGQPAEYLRQIYSNVLAEHKVAVVPGEKYPEVASERLWETIIKKLLQKDYQFDASFFGSLNEFCRKVAYFFHVSLQGTTGYPGLAQALRHVSESGLGQGILADGQCFTPIQLNRAVTRQDSTARPSELMDSRLVALSHELRGRKPSERLFRHLLSALAAQGYRPNQVLHIGSHVTHDVVPARRLGLRTGLFAGDRASLQATGDQLREQASRPDILFTELTQVADVVGEF
jgi:FMN phosphatase YigB (HAD superfamily)